MSKGILADTKLIEYAQIEEKLLPDFLMEFRKVILLSNSEEARELANKLTELNTKLGRAISTGSPNRSSIEQEIARVREKLSIGGVASKEHEFHEFCKRELKDFNDFAQTIKERGGPRTGITILKKRETMRQKIIREYVMQFVLRDSERRKKLRDEVISLNNINDKDTIELTNITSSDRSVFEKDSRYEGTESGNWADYIASDGGSFSWQYFSSYIVRFAKGVNPYQQPIFTLAKQEDDSNKNSSSFTPDPYISLGKDGNGPLIKFTTAGARRALVAAGYLDRGSGDTSGEYLVREFENKKIPGVINGRSTMTLDKGVFVRDGAATFFPVLGADTAAPDVNRFIPFSGYEQNPVGSAGGRTLSIGLPTVNLDSRLEALYETIIGKTADPGFLPSVIQNPQNEQLFGTYSNITSIPQNAPLANSDLMIISARTSNNTKPKEAEILTAQEVSDTLLAYFILNNFTIGYFYGGQTANGSGVEDFSTASRLFEAGDSIERSGAGKDINTEGTVPLLGSDPVINPAGIVTPAALSGAGVGFDIDLDIGEVNLDEKNQELKEAGVLEKLKERIIARTFREQCFLLDHYRQLVPYIQNERRKVENKLKRKVSREARQLLKGKSNEAEAFAQAAGSFYPYFTAIDPNPAKVANRISSIENLQPLLEAKVSQFSFLVPRVRIYKLIKKRDFLKLVSGIDSGIEGSIRQLMAQKRQFKNKKPHEFVEIEIPFKAAPDSIDINEMFLNSKPRADGVGLRSINFNFIGKNNFEVDKNIECNMSLFFRNLEDLTGGTSAVRFIDLILFGLSKNRPQVNEFNQRVDYFSPDDYRMRAVFGWEIPSDKMSDEILKGAQGKKLKKILKKNVLSLELFLSKHKVNFSQDGSGTVDIDFVAALQAEHNKIERDLLKLKSKTFKNRHSSVAAARRNVENHESILSNRRERYGALKERHAEVIKNTGGTNLLESFGLGILDILGIKEGIEELAAEKSDGGKEEDWVITQKLMVANNDIDQLEKQLKNARKTLNFLEKSQKIESYSAFIKRLYRQAMFYFDLPEGNKRIADSIVGITSRRTMVESKSYAAEMRLKIPLISGLTSRIKSLNEDKVLMERLRIQILGGGVDKKLGAIALELSKNDTDDGGKLLYKYKEGELEDLSYLDTLGRENKKEATIDPTVRRIYFTYIGEVLLAGFSLFQETFDPNVLRNHPDDKIRYLFGTVPFYDVSAEKPVIINMVDIPITLNAVQRFWFDKVIRSSRTSYKLNEFIRDVVNDLIIPYFGPDCYPNYPPSLSRRSIISLLDGRGAQGKDRVPLTGRVESLAKIKPNPGISFDNPLAKTYNYYYVYVAGSETMELTNNMSQDTKSGLYHFFIGLDRGLLKSAEFSRLDQRYLREMRTISKEDRISAQLRQPYKVVIKTFGNTLFRPGMYCYINPRVAGGSAKRKNSLTYKMNLGGYGIITKVNNFIAPGVFESELEVLLAGIVDPKTHDKMKGDIIDMRVNSLNDNIKYSDVTDGMKIPNYSSARNNINPTDEDTVGTGAANETKTFTVEGTEGKETIKRPSTTRRPTPSRPNRPEKAPDNWSATCPSDAECTKWQGGDGFLIEKRSGGEPAQREIN